MKKQLFGVALATVSITSFAQSSVTLYGIIDEGFNFTNNAAGSKAYQLESGYMQGSRWGLRGKEELGGGLATVFALENGFDVNTGALGQGGRMFGRQAYVGLTSDKLGMVTFGRQYDDMVDFVGPLTANGSWAGFTFAHPFDNDNTDNSFRVNNSVAYMSPNAGGFTGGAMYGFSNAAGGFANNRMWSAGGQYVNGSFVAAAAYLSATNPGATSAGALATNDSSFVADSLRVIGAGVSYTLSSVTVALSYTNSFMNQPASTVYLAGSIIPPGGSLSSLRFSNYEINAKWNITPSFFVGAMYTFTDGTYNGSDGKKKPKWHTTGLVADYNVSKRTDVYVDAAYVKRAGDDTDSALDTAYVSGAADVSSNRNQLVTRVGIRHFF